MLLHFDIKKGIHVTLFLLHSLGGNGEFCRIFLLLYFADLKHLSKYGSFILNDTYVAMKYGPVPFRIFCIYKQTRKDYMNESVSTEKYFKINEQQQAVALSPYEPIHIAASEAECIFETVQEYKNVPLKMLGNHARGNAWKDADINGEISISAMIRDSQASPEMVSYINLLYKGALTSQ